MASEALYHIHKERKPVLDYGSAMHYADTDATRGVVTLLAKNSIYQHTMGNNVSV